MKKFAGSDLSDKLLYVKSSTSNAGKAPKPRGKVFNRFILSSRGGRESEKVSGQNLHVSQVVSMKRVGVEKNVWKWVERDVLFRITIPSCVIELGRKGGRGHKSFLSELWNDLLPPALHGYILDFGTSYLFHHNYSYKEIQSNQMREDVLLSTKQEKKQNVSKLNPNWLE